MPIAFARCHKIGQVVLCRAAELKQIEIHSREGVRFSIPIDLDDVELPTFLGGQIAES